MALLDLWNANKEAVASLKIEQIVVTAGDGKLRDDSVCSSELRQYFQLLPLKALEEYAERCLSHSFDAGGLVLQDLVNEIGRRLDYTVTNGRYRGISGQVGYDGIWKSPEGASIVIEAKTTDAYRIKLDTVAAYRNALVTQGVVAANSSILIVVGRIDTGELEAQVRGSRHAWDVRIISVDALLKLARLKQETDDPETAEKIRALFIPVDYTRLDGIIDIMFTAATDVGTAAGEEAATAQEGDAAAPVADDGAEGGLSAINEKREELVKMMSARVGAPLLRKSRATYWDASHQTRVVCSLSKPYLGSIYRYWYAYHPSWDDFLAEGTKRFVIFGATGLGMAFVIPRDELHEKLAHLIKTTRPDGKYYWHVKILEPSPGNYFLGLSHNAQEDWPLLPFQVEIKSGS